MCWSTRPTHRKLVASTLVDLLSSCVSWVSPARSKDALVSSALMICDKGGNAQDSNMGPTYVLSTNEPSGDDRNATRQISSQILL